MGPGLTQELTCRSAPRGLTLYNLILGLLQLVRLVGPQQPSLSLPLLQGGLSILGQRCHVFCKRWSAACEGEVREKHNQALPGALLALPWEEGALPATVCWGRAEQGQVPHPLMPSLKVVQHKLGCTFLKAPGRPAAMLRHAVPKAGWPSTAGGLMLSPPIFLNRL